MENAPKPTPKTERYSRKAIFAELKDYCVLAKEHDFIEVCEWYNGKGYDITIDDKTHQFTHGQLKAIKKLVKQLNEWES